MSILSTKMRLTDLLQARRSSRDAGGPLSEAERCTLAFAAVGVLKRRAAIADLPIAASTISRTVPSPDAIQSVSLLVSAPDGVRVVPSPLEPGAERVTALHACGDLEHSSLRVSDRAYPDRQCRPFADHNQWIVDAAEQGATVFVPVANVMPLFVNLLLFLFEEPRSARLHDERAWFAILGHRKTGRTMSEWDTCLAEVERAAVELATIELGASIQNMSLQATELGLDACIGFTPDPESWLRHAGLSGRTTSVPRRYGYGRLASRLLGALAPAGSRKTVWSPELLGSPEAPILDARPMTEQLVDRVASRKRGVSPAARERTIAALDKILRRRGRLISVTDPLIARTALVVSRGDTAAAT